MASDHRGKPLHAGKRTDDEFFYPPRPFPAPRPSQRLAETWDPKIGKVTYGPETAPPAGSKTIGELEQENNSHIVSRFDQPSFYFDN